MKLYVLTRVLRNPRSECDSGYRQTVWNTITISLRNLYLHEDQEFRRYLPNRSNSVRAAEGMIGGPLQSLDT